MAGKLEPEKAKGNGLTHNNRKVSPLILNNLVEKFPLGIAIVKPEGKTLYRNQAWAEMRGYGSVEASKDLSTAAAVYYDPNDRERFLELLSQGPVANFEVRLKKKDGTPFWASLTARLEKDESGKTVIITAFSDIDARKKAEEAHKSSEEKFRNLLENLPVSVFITNPDGSTASEPNKATLEMYRLETKDEFQKIPAEQRYFDLEDRKDWIETMSKGSVKDFELRLKRKDGTIFWASRSSASLKTENGEKRIIVTADISRIKEAEEELKKHRNNLEELVARRTAELTRQSEIVSRQAQEILEISTPVMQLWKGVLVAPLIGTLDSERTQRFMERLLQRIVDTDSGTVLVDITGVPAIDTATAQHLIETITAVKLLGAQVILTGVRPAIAQTLVQLNIDLAGIKTSSSLAMGLQMALKMASLPERGNSGKTE